MESLRVCDSCYLAQERTAASQRSHSSQSISRKDGVVGLSMQRPCSLCAGRMVQYSHGVEGHGSWPRCPVHTVICSTDPNSAPVPESCIYGLRSKAEEAPAERGSGSYILGQLSDCKLSSRLPQQHPASLVGHTHHTTMDKICASALGEQCLVVADVGSCAAATTSHLLICPTCMDDCCCKGDTTVAIITHSFERGNALLLRSLACVCRTNLPFRLAAPADACDRVRIRSECDQVRVLCKGAA